MVRVILDHGDVADVTVVRGGRKRSAGMYELVFSLMAASTSLPPPVDPVLNEHDDSVRCSMIFLLLSAFQLYDDVSDPELLLEVVRDPCLKAVSLAEFHVFKNDMRRQARQLGRDFPDVRIMNVFDF